MQNRADTVTSSAGDTLSAIAWRYYGTSRGQVERILAANPGLSAQPAVLPAGINIRLPAPQEETPIIRTLNLWD